MLIHQVSSPSRYKESPPEQTDPSGSGLGSEEKLERLLAAAASLMAARGYSQTSIRNVGRKTGFSLAGMYYYFENKEDLLYQIQHRTFAALLAEQEAAVKSDGDPENRLRLLVKNHLAYFTHHFNELKVCTFELHTLEGQKFREIETLRRRYFRCVARVIGEFLGIGGEESEEARSVRHNTLFVFGMLNWIFMWFEPQRDGPVEKLGEEMVEFILKGLSHQLARS